MNPLAIAIAVAFALMLPRGTSIPYLRRPYLTRQILLLNILVFIVLQVSIIQGHLPFRKMPRTFFPTAYHLDVGRQFLDVVGLTPSRLEGFRRVQFITANFVHTDWVRLLFNIWVFALVSINLEDVLGRARFVFFLAGSVLIVQLGTSIFALLSGSGERPYAGFHGLTYAAIAAYLTAFPRSKIRVTFVSDPWFIATVLIAVTPIAYGLSYPFGTYAWLLWLATYVILFGIGEPRHLLYAAPALVVLGVKVLFDIIDLLSYRMPGTPSVGGIVCGIGAGVAGGLLVRARSSRLKNLVLPQEEPGPKTLSNPRQLMKRFGQHPAVDPKLEDRKFETDVKANLLHLIYVGDVAGAVKLYLEEAAGLHPELILPPPQQITLARMLERSGNNEEALRAYEILIKQMPDEPGVEPAYLAAAALCKAKPHRLLDALQYLQKFVAFQATWRREILAAEQLRKELEECASNVGIQLPGTAGLEFEPETKNQTFKPEHAAADQFWERKLPLKGMARRRTRASEAKVEPGCAEENSTAARVIEFYDILPAQKRPGTEDPYGAIANVENGKARLEIETPIGEDDAPVAPFLSPQQGERSSMYDEPPISHVNEGPDLHPGQA